MSSDYFDVHLHSRYSVLDALGSVEDKVLTAYRRGRPAISLTDHGTMAGCLRLYKACMKYGMACFPGIEWYVVKDAGDEDERGVRFHLGMLALNERGYRAMVKLSSFSFSKDRFYRRPIVDLRDLAALAKDYGDDVAVTTGCYFGLVVQPMMDQGYKAGVRQVKLLASWFPNLFVEVQNHGVVHDDGTDDEQVAGMLFDIADDLGLPVVLGQDSHYTHQGEQIAHDMMKDICYFGDGEDNRFPGGPYQMAGVKNLKPLWTPDQWDRIEEGHGALLDLNQLVLPALDTYKFHVPEITKDPIAKLKKLCIAGAKRLGIGTDDREYNARANHEMGVFQQMGVGNYFVLGYELAEFCRTNGIFIDSRGSANGSLICYLLGITTVDPIQWGTDFGRFLSLDRKKPPDIDFDVEHDRRWEVLAWLWSRFPTMVRIGTYGRIGITVTEDGEDKGSVFVQYAAAKRSKTGMYHGIADEDRPGLQALDRADAYKSLGVHAGGLVLPGEGLAIEDYLATARVISSDTTVTQAPMDDVEDAGYMKLDVLGLRMLSTMRHCMELIGKDPVKDGMLWIPPDDPDALKLLRTGRTGNGVFQFEGYSTAMGAKEMKVSSTLEAIACLSLYRPAVMDGGQKDRYLAARKAKTPEPAPHKAIEEVLADTWGVPIFQDQVMQIMRAVGLPYEDLNDVLKAVKASNDKITEYAEATFERVEPIFIQCGCNNLGLSIAEGKALWKEVLGFTDYGFNKAHATNYGLRGYRMAYLKAHYPAEFMAATLSTWSSTPKEAKYVQEARKSGFRIARPDVNLSGVRWTIDGPGQLRKGLMSIKGVGDNAAPAIIEEREANGPYIDATDFSHRLPAKKVTGSRDLPKGVLKGVCKALAEAGALRAIGIQP